MVFTDKEEYMEISISVAISMNYIQLSQINYN